MDIIKHALALAQGALMETRYEAESFEQSVAYSDRLHALRGRAPNDALLSKVAAKRAKLDFRTQLQDLCVVLFEHGQHGDVVLGREQVAVFAQKVLSLHDALGVDAFGAAT